MKFRRWKQGGWLSLVFCCFANLAGTQPSLKVDTFKQEVSTIFTQKDGLPSDEITCLAVDVKGYVYAGTNRGIAVFHDNQWSDIQGLHDRPIQALAHREGRTVAAASKALFEITDTYAVQIAEVPFESISDMALGKNSVYIVTGTGLYQVKNKRVRPDKRLNGLLEENTTIHHIDCFLDDIAVAADAGLFLKSGNKDWKALYPASEDGRSWAPTQVHGVVFDRLNRLWFASPQGAGCYDEFWTLYSGQDGLPYNDFTCAAAGEIGVVWFGTKIGAIRFDGKKWEYRQGRRWLPDDVIHDIAVSSNGDAWFATSKGVGLIQQVPMTLAEKATFYEKEVEKYIKRTEYGYLSEVSLKVPGDKSEIIYHDSDNDGLWTAMYGAGECFAYAATKHPRAKERAKQAFEALRFLSIAPIGGEVKQQPGFVARTVLPTTEPDPNKREPYTLEGMKRRREKEDHRWKVYFPRWPLTQDRRYWYKTDTSSDELDGHFFFYALYHDLVAETNEEKERVRDVVRNITDHLLRNDFCLIDHDGTPTRWAVFSPKALNQDVHWYTERGLNSLSILSYLTVAEHLTGDPKYTQALHTLIEKHHYDINAMVTKVQFGIGSANQSDDEMAFMNYFNVIHYTKDEALRAKMILSFYQYWVLECPEMNPFFNFAYASCGLNSQYGDPWGSYRLDPWEGWLTDAVDTLKGFPLDRLNWAHKNSHRIDIIRLPRQAASFPTDPPRTDRGYRVNGKVLPVQERHFNHWNTDPWALDYGGNGRVLASGTVFLLPYYMGLYYGYVK